MNLKLNKLGYDHSYTISCSTILYTLGVNIYMVSSKESNNVIRKSLDLVYVQFKSAKLTSCKKSNEMCVPPLGLVKHFDSFGDVVE